MRRPSLLLLTLALTAPLASVACAPSDDADVITADSESDLVSRVAGSSITSPNAKATATYLSARKIGTLEQVGALKGAVAALAHRVDGIIANQPADGRFSVQELLQIEKPGFVETLFPEEKAALKGVWELLETIDTAPASVTVGPAAPFSAVDLSTTAGAPIKPASLAIASLPAHLQAPAQRLELTRNDDGDATTVTEADLDAAIATPGPYTPADIAAFQAIKLLFVERAGTSLSARVEVPVPFAARTSIATFGAAELTLVESLSYSEQRASSLFSGHGGSGSLGVTVDARVERRLEVALAGEQKLLLLDETTDEERVVGAGAIDLRGGATTIELWSGGTRLGAYRAQLPAIAAKNERIDLRAFADYTFVAGGVPLVRNLVEAKQEHRSWWNQWRGSESSTTNSALFRIETTPAPPTGEVSQPALAAVRNPGFSVPPGRYEIDVPSVGTCQLDLFPEGIIRFTRPGGATMRSGLYVWGVPKHTVDFPDRLRMIYDGKTMQIFFDGRGSVFDGPLTAAHRKG